MTYTCSQGHVSDDPDFCSECGLRIGGDPSAPAPTPPEQAEACPICQATREPGATFCEVCKYNFATRKPHGVAPTPVAVAVPHGVAPVASPTPAPVVPAPAPAPTPPVAAPSPASTPETSPFYGCNPWVRVIPDRSLASPEDADAFPGGDPETAFPLDIPESLVGRRSNRPGSHPEIPVNDHAVSSRHLKLCARPNGMVLVDLGSTNGTRVNDVPVKPGVEVPVGPDDRIVIGAWTRLVLEARR